MKIETLTLEHQDILYPKLKMIDTLVSEYSFSNLYLFRKAHDYKVAMDDGHIFILGKSYDKTSYIMPTEDIRNMDLKYLKEIINEYKVIFPIPEEWIHVFNQDEFIYTYDDGESDYIHGTEKMGSYKGKKMHKKRNLLNQFLNLYESEAHPLVEEKFDDAYKILEIWQKETALDTDDTDYLPCKEALDLYEELHICGGIYYAEGEPAGFIIGEEINDKTFVIHFAKATRKFKGIYQFMFNNFANILPEKYEYLNFEQDLGKESLRQAKSTYRPEIMIKKYKVSHK